MSINITLYPNIYDKSRNPPKNIVPVKVNETHQQTKNIWNEVYCIVEMPSQNLVLFGCDDSSKLALFDVESSECRLINMPDDYVTTICPIDYECALVGTNEGTLVLVNIVNEFVIKKVSIKGERFRKISFDQTNKKIIITSVDKLWVFDKELTLLCQFQLDFNPYDFCYIEKQQLIVIGGTQSQLQLFSYQDSLNRLTKLELINQYTDITSVIYSNLDNQIIVSVDSLGLLIYEIKNNQLEIVHNYGVKDNACYTQLCDSLIAFSTAEKGLMIINKETNDLLHINNIPSESKVAMTSIEGITKIAFFQAYSELAVLSFVDFYEIEHLVIKDVARSSVNMIITHNGKLFYPNREEICFSDINIEKNSFTKGFLINNKSDQVFDYNSRGLRFLDFNLKVLANLKIDNFNQEYNILQFKDNIIIMTDNYKETLIIKKIINNHLKEIGKYDISFKSIQLSGDFLYIVVDKKGIAYNLESEMVYYSLKNEKIIKTMDIGVFVGFTNPDTILSNLDGKDVLLNLITFNKTYFDIRYILSSNSIYFSADNRYCLHLSADEMFVADISKQGERLWLVEDPDLMEYRVFSYNSTDDTFWILNEYSSQIISFDINSANIRKLYQIPQTASKIKLDFSGKHLFWINNEGQLSKSEYPFTDLQIHNINKTDWRNIAKYKIENTNHIEDTLRHIDTMSFEDIWLTLIDRVNNLKFSSYQTASHQLNPWDVSLLTPDIKYLEKYDANKTLRSLLGLESGFIEMNGDMLQMSVIYHELFHVIQADSTKSVFNYFYLISKLQNNRKELLNYLVAMNFFELIDDIYVNSVDKCKSIYHCVRLTEFEDLIKLAELYSKTLKDVAKYFLPPMDNNVHTFQIIEGSAEVFGLCCTGINVIDILDKRLIEVDTDDNNELYLRAYSLFRKNSGTIPLVFILICFVSLKYGQTTGFDSKNTVPDIFEKCLKQLNVWEKTLKSKIDNINLESIVLSDLISEIYMSIIHFVEGAFKVQASAFHDNDKNLTENLFKHTIYRLRERFPKKTSIDSIMSLILDVNYTKELHKIFTEETTEFSEELRVYKCVKDFESFLLNSVDFNSENPVPEPFNLYCCAEHGEVTVYDDWHQCTNDDSFINVFKNTFNNEFPEKFYDK